MFTSAADFDRTSDLLASRILEKLEYLLRDRLVAPEYLSPKQVSKYTGFSVKTLEGMRGMRTGPRYYKPNGRVRYKRSDVDDWMERNGPVD